MTFLNIFSTAKPRVKKETPKEKIIIDYREKQSLIPSLLEKDFEIEFKELKVADYLLKGVAIERKTISDFISSMINRRLIRQLEELQQYPNRLLILEGIEEQELYSDESSTKGINPNAIRGFLLSILLRYRVPIIFTKNHKDTASFLSVLAKKKKTELPLNIKKKSLNKKEQLQFILESFPGIGPKTAKKMLEKFGSIKKIINSSEEELKEILGVKAETIKKIIEEDY